ncbi:eCIS core domain-containing protein [Allosphingosinicella deserti]|uniref:eCIS core domain-containing protein n=1 Tax=Allosphingosinicella deserti TaxID=2116704 RepID=A0A2P7QQZ9_9SPHN|nr:DUF4157 domain-containing protein [Sphingomonas deserti]PSJ40396.1 hypothetical protein C7I55_08615 [Sphingomonas deserti]
MSAHSNHMRSLTPGEIALCRGVFPDALPYEDVRLCDGPAVNDLAERAFHNRNTAITLRRTIYFRVRYCRDFAHAGDEARRLFLHEMTHVWQWRTLGVPRFLLRYGRELAGCRLDAAAMYRYEGDPRPFSRCRLEAQAEMVGDYQRPSLRPLIAPRLQGTGLYGL